MKPTRRYYIPKHSAQISTKRQARIEQWKTIGWLTVATGIFLGLYFALDALGI